MQKKRRLQTLLSTITIAVAASCAASSAWSIGWGRAPQTAVLGQPLDFAVSLRLDPGDTVEPQCVAAEVTLGDARVQPSNVRLAVDATNPEALAIRVLTTVGVEEPVLSVLVSIGCPARMSRRFTLLADPATVAPVPVQLLPNAQTSNNVALAAPAPAAVPASAQTSAGPRAKGSGAGASAPRRRALAPARAHPAVVAEAESSAPAAARQRARSAEVTASASVAAAPRSRLRLDAAEPVPQPAVVAASAVEQAIEAVALAASSARAAASAASAADERIASLERTVAEMRATQKANDQAVAQLRGQLAESESAARWAKPVALAAAALLLLSAWLAWRLRAVNVERQRAWRLAAEAQARAEQMGAPPRAATPASQLPMVTTEIPQPPVAPPVFVPDPEDQALDIPVATTDIMPVGSSADSSAPRDVTIEELLDLEQQAEFFVVLGQDDAAIDLLVHHLRDTGGGSPLPYLKLLEIHRRRGEREQYERTRARFNHRFNAYAPDWDADLQHGRTLEDYPEVLPRLQQVWAHPLDAMAELEALLFRKSRGELFDLPAYREVLFLYQLARDLLDREQADSTDVDLLLPLAERSDFGSTSPGSYFSLDGEGAAGSVDLDLTEPGTPPPAGGRA